jgi:hypothetical protein
VSSGVVWRAHVRHGGGHVLRGWIGRQARASGPVSRSSVSSRAPVPEAAPLGAGRSWGGSGGGRRGTRSVGPEPVPDVVIMKLSAPGDASAVATSGVYPDPVRRSTGANYRRPCCLRGRCRPRRAATRNRYHSRAGRCGHDQRSQLVRWRHPRHRASPYRNGVRPRTAPARACQVSARSHGKSVTLVVTQPAAAVTESRRPAAVRSQL